MSDVLEISGIVLYSTLHQSLGGTPSAPAENARTNQPAAGPGRTCLKKTSSRVQHPSKNSAEQLELFTTSSNTSNQSIAHTHRAMTTRKRNEFLDIESSDDEGDDRGYDSEAAEETKGGRQRAGGSKKEKDGSGRAAKRRRISVDEVADSEEEESEGESESDGGVDLRDHNGRKEGDGEEEDDDYERSEQDGENKKEDTTPSSPTSTSDKSSKSGKKEKNEKKKPLDPAKQKQKQKKNKTGVIYLSSLPPYLKPSALKSLLLQRGFGPITKVFLTPETPPPGSSRLKKSNRRRSYVDGWVEFASKRTAKICAETLNATIVGGRKGGYYHDDVWNMKYLKGFKWSDLMEQVQRERSEREARRRIEDARARKEEKVFLQGVEKGKVIEGIQKKKEEKRKRKRESGEDVDDSNEAEQLEIRRVFKQNKVQTKEDRDASALGEDTKRVLGKIF